MTLAEFEPSYISVNETGDVLTVRFLLSHLTDEENIEQLGQELFTLVDQFGCRKLILDLNGVRYVTSSVLGKLITLHRRMHRHGGRMVICCLEVPVREILTMSRLHDYLHLVENGAAAMAEVARESQNS